ncbi:MAG: DUF3667 domain-containing protein [Sphingomonas sp.]|nr:DUF3667 domain-containing protein [Sphingomonas sp.]
MQGGFEAAGDLATGGLIGRALEPEAGEAAAHGAHAHGNCLNCQTPLVGDYCHACGQAAHVHKTLWSIVHDVLHGVFHFEGKIYRTIPMLFYKPGSLTRRYIAGERVRFVSPLALFLFSVFLMVATFETIGGPFGTPGKKDSFINLNTTELKAEVAKNQALEAQLAPQLAALKNEQAATKAKGGNTDPIDDRVDKLEDRLESVRDDLKQARAAQDVADGKTGVADAVSKNNFNIHTGSATLDNKIKKASKSPELFLYKVQSSAYKFSWALVPISLPFIWLLFFWHRSVGPYDHAIFAIYSLSAMTLGAVALSVLRAIGVPGTVIGVLFVWGPPIHMYKQLRGAYVIGRFGAAWRTVVLLLSAIIAGALFFVVVLSLAS